MSKALHPIAKLINQLVLGFIYEIHAYISLQHNSLALCRIVLSLLLRAGVACGTQRGSCTIRKTLRIAFLSRAPTLEIFCGILII